MIHHVSGDILLTKAQAIAHGIAANDPMNQGLARSLHELYPAMHKDFHHWCHHHHPNPGEAWMWRGSDGARVINLITQEGGYGHGTQPGKATIPFVRQCLRALMKIIKAESLSSIALPKLATGVGGLEWDEVLPIVEDKLEGLDISIYVYSEFHAGKQAKEPRQ